MFPPTVTGFAGLPIGAAGSFGTAGEAGAMPVSAGTAPVGWPALGSAGGAGIAASPGMVSVAGG